MPSIGGVSCDFIPSAERPAAVLREEVELFRMPGISGYGALLTGRADGAFRIEAVKYVGDASAARVWETALHALQGQVVTIVDDQGTIHTYCLLTHVGNATVQAGWSPGTGVAQRASLTIDGVKVG
jgi:hypothetical protein